MRFRRAVLAAILVWLAACEVPGAPKWNVDIFFPIKYPDVQLSQYGPAVPPFSVTFTPPVDSQLVSDATRQIFDEDIDSLKAEVVFANTTNVTGTLDISIAANQAFLFSTNSGQAVTISVPIRVTAGDTTRVQVNTNLFKTAQKLYTQSRATMQSSTGGFVPLSAADKFTVGVDLTANVKMSK